MSSLSWRRVLKNRSSNYRIAIFAAIIWSLVFSISLWTIFDAYISLLAKTLGHQYTNSWVGIAESINGMSILVVALPVGWLVDRFSRTALLRLASVIGVAGVALTALGIYKDHPPSILVALVVLGIFNEFYSSASNAIFADSVQAGNRAAAFVTKGAAEFAGLSAGPVILCFMFLMLGDREWTISVLHRPLLAGLALAPVGLVLLFLFRDPYPHYFADGPLSAEKGAGPETHAAEFSRSEKWIPWLVAVSDMFRAIGAGMTVRFFALFFINDYKFRPEQISGLFAVYPACIILFQYIIGFLARVIGRVQATYVFQICGISCLLGMYYLQNVELLLIFFLVRGSFQNAISPIDRSIVNDFIPSEHRGFWNALESVTNATWAGSAAFGGWLSDVSNYRLCFLITAFIYFVSLLIYTPLLRIVPRADKVALKNSTTLHSPLLSPHSEGP